MSKIRYARCVPKTAVLAHRSIHCAVLTDDFTVLPLLFASEIGHLSELPVQSFYFS